MLGREPDLDALAGREAVRDERRLERDDAAAVFERGRHLGASRITASLPSCAQQRAAACETELRAADRKPAASASPAPVVSTTVAATAG